MSFKSIFITPRKLTYLFFKMSYPDRMKLIMKLGLSTRPEDDGITDAELIKRVVRRARDRGQLDALRDAIVAQA